MKARKHFTKLRRSERTFQATNAAQRTETSETQARPKREENGVAAPEGISQPTMNRL